MSLPGLQQKDVAQQSIHFYPDVAQARNRTTKSPYHCPHRDPDRQYSKIPNAFTRTVIHNPPPRGPSRNHHPRPLRPHSLLLPQMPLLRFLFHHPPDARRMTRFVDLILARSRFLDQHAPQYLRPRTVFFGGGTPTLLPTARNAPAHPRPAPSIRFLQSASNGPSKQIPPPSPTNTADMLAAAGVNRISMGAQSFNSSRTGHPRTPSRSRRCPPQPRHHQIRRHPPGSISISSMPSPARHCLPGSFPRARHRPRHRTSFLLRPHLRAQHPDRRPPPSRPDQFHRPRSRNRNAPRNPPPSRRRRISSPTKSATIPAPNANAGTISFTGHGGDYLSLGPAAASHVQGWPLAKPPPSRRMGKRRRPPANFPPSKSKSSPPTTAPANSPCSCFACQRGSFMPTLPPAWALTPAPLCRSHRPPCPPWPAGRIRNVDSLIGARPSSRRFHRRRIPRSRFRLQPVLTDIRLTVDTNPRE